MLLILSPFLCASGHTTSLSQGRICDPLGFMSIHLSLAFPLVLLTYNVLTQGHLTLS